MDSNTSCSRFTFIAMKVSHWLDDHHPLSQGKAQQNLFNTSSTFFPPFFGIGLKNYTNTTNGGSWLNSTSYKRHLEKKAVLPLSCPLPSLRGALSNVYNPIYSTSTNILSLTYQIKWSKTHRCALVYPGVTQKYSPRGLWECWQEALSLAFFPNVRRCCRCFWELDHIRQSGRAGTDISHCQLAKAPSSTHSFPRTDHPTPLPLTHSTALPLNEWTQTNTQPQACTHTLTQLTYDH